MLRFRRKCVTLGLLSGCALGISGPAWAADQTVPPALPAQDALAAFLAGGLAGSVDAAPGMPPETGSTMPPAPIQDWIAVDSTVLERLRGGFDLAPGLKVSFGIERIVNLNGVLQTATRIEVPDAGRLVQVMQAPALPQTGARAQAPVASVSAGTSEPAETSALPVATNPGNGAAALIQNGGGNTFFSSGMSPEAAATIIQNSASNQTIQSLTVINAATNSLELLKGANLQSTLLDALTRSTRSP